jgi:two-component sensor histidine kinase
MAQFFGPSHQGAIAGYLVMLDRLRIGHDGRVQDRFVVDLARGRVSTGTLDIAGAAHDTEVVVVWTERGGPPVVALAGEGGYGSKLLNRSMTLQLGGSISCDWSAEGVIVALDMTKDRLTH